MIRKPNLIALCALAIVALAASVPAAASSSKQGVTLQSTGLDADASGRLRARIRGSEGQLDLRVRRLDPSATYEIVADGVRVGELVTGRSGTGRIRLRSRPRSSRDQLLGFDPRGATLVIRDAQGGDVLAAQVPAAGEPQGGDVICCIPDDSGPECEDRTPAECAAQGGTVSTATSCLPSPCAGTPPPPDTDVVCCIPDDSGTECEDRTIDECALQGGTVVEGSSCDPNPCSAIPPADDDTRCCLPDDSGAECEDRTPAECLAQGGIDVGPGSCTPNPCGDVNPPPGGGNASVRVECEQRASRSRVSVNGSGLAAGTYSARVVSGGNQAVSGPAAAIGDEAEFDFDSDGGDIGEGATPIVASFLQGNPPQALGQILDAQGAVVAETLATCEVR